MDTSANRNKAQLASAIPSRRPPTKQRPKVILAVNICLDKPTLVAQLDVCPSGDQEVQVQPPLGQQHSLVEIGHEIFSMVILSLLLIQDRQLSVSVEKMCTILLNPLED